jgi:universal stress protein A
MSPMYRRILVAIENSEADRTILAHVTALARLTGAELVLVHVADGWAARNFDRLKLRESEEMRGDREYLERLAKQLTDAGLHASTRLAMGDPASELVKLANAGDIDLIAMATHGHRYLADLVHGTTVDRVRHLVTVPVLLLKGSAPSPDRQDGGRK